MFYKLFFLCIVLIGCEDYRCRRTNLKSLHLEKIEICKYYFEVNTEKVNFKYKELNNDLKALKIIMSDDINNYSNFYIIQRKYLGHFWYNCKEQYSVDAILHCYEGMIDVYRYNEEKARMPLFLTLLPKVDSIEFYVNKTQNDNFNWYDVERCLSKDQFLIKSINRRDSGEFIIMSDKHSTLFYYSYQPVVNRLSKTPFPFDTTINYSFY